MARLNRTDLLVMYTSVQSGIEPSTSRATSRSTASSTRRAKLKEVFADAVNGIQATESLLERYRDACSSRSTPPRTRRP